MAMEAVEDIEDIESAILEGDVVGDLEEEGGEEEGDPLPAEAESGEDPLLPKLIKRPKLRMTSVVPKPDTKRGPSVPKQATASRLHRASVLREAFSKYPNEIEGGVKNVFRPPLSTDGMSEPLRGFYEILRTYMGADPNSLDFDVIEDRILRSSKALDESDSEHYQRIASALQIVNTIKNSRVATLRDLVGLSQKEVNDDRQHHRYLRAIDVKRDKTDSEIRREKVATEDAAFELASKQNRAKTLGGLQAKLERRELMSKLALHSTFPDRPLESSYYDSDDHHDSRFKERMKYVSVII